MAISRDWYNTLVDDDGSGTTGTIWRKDSVNQILTAVDGLAQPSAVWTPTLTFGGAAAGMVYSARTGIFTRYENLIAAEFRIALSAKGSSVGGATITGVPYPAVAAPAGSFDPAGGMVAMPGVPFCLVSISVVYLMCYTATSRTPLTDAHFSNTSDIRGVLVYHKAPPGVVLDAPVPPGEGIVVLE
jgi:hypothetical protein